MGAASDDGRSLGTLLMHSVGPRSRSWFILPTGLLCATILPAFLRIGLEDWPSEFDDAFITYRYAKNLALGHGITWNPGQPPTEGYTNFLLLIFLAPWIKAGVDPLLVTRLVSFASLCGIVVVLYRLSRRRFGASGWMAALIASIVLMAPEAKHLPLTGLETVLYACFLLLAFARGIDLIERQTAAAAITFSVWLFATMLLRPEAVLLYPVIVAGFFAAPVRRDRAALHPLLVSLILLSAAGGVYLAWKYAHFAALLPNPFYVKAAGGGLVSSTGLRSVGTFLTGHASLLAWMFPSLLIGLLWTRPEVARNRVLLAAAAAFAGVYGLFFLRTDTLVDTYGRFLFPLVPFLVLLAAPALTLALEALERIANARSAALCGTIAFLLAFGSADLIGVFSNVRRVVSGAGGRTSGLMVSERHVARALARFPAVASVKIAFGDAGVIPYYTGAQWLDVVGLNDSYLARERDRSRAADYFFDWSPDLVIQPGSQESSWIRHGHGPLGDYLSWAHDPRWDGYQYAGTTRTGARYDLQYFVRKSSRFKTDLERFLRAEVVDGWYEPFPLPIGTYAPPDGADATWVPRSR
jgi:arabinofuranosyltransferase